MWHWIKDSNPYFLILIVSYWQVKWILQYKSFLHNLVKTKCHIAEGLNSELSVLECLYQLKTWALVLSEKSHVVEK